MSLLGRVVGGQEEVYLLELLIFLLGWPPCVGGGGTEMGLLGTQHSRGDLFEFSLLTSAASQGGAR